MDRRTAASRDHVHEHGAVVVVFGIGTIYNLAQTKPVLVVGIGVGMRTVGDGGKLFAFLRERSKERSFCHIILLLCGKRAIP